MSGAQTGSRAPAFHLTGIDGNAYSFPGRCAGVPVLVVFGKTGCGACDLAFPYLNRLHDSYPEGWEIWAVLQDGRPQAQDYAEEMRIRYPVLIDETPYEVSRLYDPPATPSLFLVAPDGAIEMATHGFSKADLNEVSRRVAAHLGVPPVEIAPAGDGKPAVKPG